MINLILIETCPECGHDLYHEVLTVYPPIHKKMCPSCGWCTHESQEIVRVPYEGNRITQKSDVSLLAKINTKED